MIRFSVMADLHTDIIHDGADRVAEFVKRTNEAGCDFAIQLGDFIQPEYQGSYTCSEDRVSLVMRNNLNGKGATVEDHRAVWAELGKLDCSLYHVLGNHDLDLYTKEEIMGYWGMQKPYYSFDVRDYHFIVLDENYGFEDGEAVEFSRGNYLKWFFQKTEPFPYLPKDQLDWLEQDLRATDKPTIIFSHEGINGGFLNVINHEEICAVLKAAPHKVRLAICGHKHEDLFEEEAGIPVYFVNSMSGYSVPPKYARHRFDEKIEEKYPNVQYTAIYRDPLYVIVTIEEDKISMDGVTSEFVSPTPKEMGLTEEWPHIHFDARTSSLTIPLK